MRTRTMFVGTLIGCLLLSTGPVLGQEAVSQAITFQGRLMKDGQVLNEPVDVIVTLYDSEGTAGSTEEMSGVPVSEGLLTVRPQNLGGAFWGKAYTIEFQVRHPAGTGNYVTLSPRVPITASPYAHAPRPGFNLFDPTSGLANMGYFFGNEGHVLMTEINGQGFALRAAALASGGQAAWLSNNDTALPTVDIRNGGGGPALALQGRLVSDSSLVTKGVFSALNPNNESASVFLGWRNDVARIRVGGSGAGNGNGFDFQTVNDRSLLRLLHNGNVGIGDTAPDERLTVRGTVHISANGAGIKFSDGSIQTSAAEGGLILPYNGRTSQNDTAFKVTHTGQDRAGQFVAESSTNPNAALQAETFGTGPAMKAVNLGTTGSAGLFINSSSQSTSPALVASVAGSAAYAIQAIGGITTDELEITGGADIAEPFDVHGVKPKPGMVLVIDPGHPGDLTRSSTPYDKKVAGVISGAGGVRPGLHLGQKGTAADGEHPVALTGRVYVWCDTANGAIEPGDLLTTSSTPGHAMKATDRERAQGAVLGKAMTPLRKGKGLVLVLVTLQ